MTAIKSSWVSGGLGFLVVVSLLLALSGCGEKEATPTPTPTATPTPTPTATPTPTPTPTETISVSMLIQVEDGDTRWFRDVSVPKGTDAWELTEQVTEGDIKANYFPMYRSHFVDAIFGVEGASPKFWLIYIWSEPESKWESLPVGADLFSLKEGHTLAWYYTDTAEMSVPPVTP